MQYHCIVSIVGKTDTFMKSAILDYAISLVIDCSFLGWMEGYFARVIDLSQSCDFLTYSCNKSVANLNITWDAEF